MKKGWKQLLRGVILTLIISGMPFLGEVHAAEYEPNGGGKEKIDAIGEENQESTDISDYVDLAEDKLVKVEIRQGGDNQVFRFVPNETKQYTFFAIGDYDTYGTIRNASGLQIAESDDDNDDEINFAATVTLNKGETYYLVARMYNGSRTGSFYCMVSSTRSNFRLEAEDIAGFEVLEPSKNTWYENEEVDPGFLQRPSLKRLKYRITTKDGQILEDVVSKESYYINVFGLFLGGRYKYLTEDLDVDQSRDDNAVIYYVYEENEEEEAIVLENTETEIPITFGAVSPVAAVTVVTNPFPENIRLNNADDVLDDRTGLKLKVTYTDGTEKTVEVISDTDESENGTWVDDGCFSEITYQYKDVPPGEEPEVGNSFIVISYMGKSAEIPVTILKGIQFVRILKNPEKMYYLDIDSEIDLYGLQFSVAYSDGTDSTIEVTEHTDCFLDGTGEEVSSRLCWDESGGYIEFIQASYAGYIFYIELERPVKEISIERNPDKMVYTPFDRRPDLYGMVLRISYRDEISKTVQVTSHDNKYCVEDEYGNWITSGFTVEYDDNDNERKTGVWVRYMGSPVSYTPQFTNYAPLLSGAVDIVVGQTVQVSLNDAVAYRVFRFVAPETGKYIFKSSGDFDPYVHLVDASGNSLTAADDNDDDDYNFTLEYQAEKGKTCYYFVASYNSGETTFPCSLTADMLVLNKTSIQLVPGAGEKLTAVIPSGLAGQTVTWTSSNPVVAAVSPDGTVTAAAGGTAVITASVGGQTAACQVIVPYGITYHLNGGVNSVENPAYQNNETIILKAPSRAKYAFEGWYTDSAYKTKITQITAGSNQAYNLYAKWKKISKPGATKLLTAKNAKGKKISVKCRKVKKADGYEIAYSTSKKIKKSTPVVTSKKVKAVISGLKKGKTYYVRVRAYNLDSAGNRIWGAWTAAKKVTVKK